MKLDRSKPFGEIRDMAGLAGYIQNGIEYDIAGQPMNPGAQPMRPPPAPIAAPPPTPPREPIAQPVALGASEQPEMDDDEDDGEPVHIASGERGEVMKPLLSVKHLGAGRYTVVDSTGARLVDEYMDRDAADAYVAEHGA